MINHNMHDRKMSETPPRTVQSDAILLVVAVKPSEPFVDGTLKRKIVTIV